MSPNNDGKMIRLTVPPMSGEQRQKMVARIKKSAEEAKVACRNIRRDGNKHFDAAEKDKEMTEDDRDKGKEEVQALLKTVRGQDRRTWRTRRRKRSWNSKHEPPKPRQAAESQIDRCRRHDESTSVSCVVSSGLTMRTLRRTLPATFPGARRAA